MPYPILLYETGFWPLQHSAMSRHLAYFRKVDDMDVQHLPPRALLLAQGPQQLKRVWQEHCKGWFATWSIDYQQIVAMPGTKKQDLHLNECFASTLWSAAALAKPKMQYYHMQINPALEHGPHKYLKAHIFMEQWRAIFCKNVVPSSQN